MTDIQATPPPLPAITTKFVPLEKIRTNTLNPRRVFLEKDIDELCKSIVEVGGIIVPLVVSEIDNSYVLLDGERRLRAARKLNMKEVQVNVIPKQLSDSDNLSLMFNIHMQRLQWNPATRAKSLGQLRKLMPGIQDPELSKLTGMSNLEIANADLILSFPPKLQKRCLEDQKDFINPNYLIEMAKAIGAIKENTPSLFKKFGKAKIVRSFVAKIDNNIVVANTDFRMVRRIASDLPPKEAEALLRRLIVEKEFSPRVANRIAADMLQSFDEFKRKSIVYLSALHSIKIQKIDKNARKSLVDVLRKVSAEINQKLRQLTT